MSADDFTVTPWNVSGKIDYEKLTKRFGTEKMTHAMLDKMRTAAGEDHFMLRRGVFFSIEFGLTHRALKKLANVNTQTSIVLALGKNGLEAVEHGLPERRLIKLLEHEPMSIADASSKLGGAFGSAIKSARESGFVSVKDGILSLEKPAPKLLPGEKVLELFKSGGFADPGREIAEKYAKSDPGYVQNPDFFKTKKTNRNRCLTLAIDVDVPEVQTSSSIRTTMKNFTKLA